MWRDSETEIDYLNFGYLVGLLKEMINNDGITPATIGVYGDWGSGKSSLIRMSIEDLKQEKDGGKIVTLNFNGWLFEGYEDAKSVLLETILDCIKENTTLSQEAKEIITGLYRSIDKIKLLKKGVMYAIDIATTGGIGVAIDQISNHVKAFTGQELSEKQLEKTKNEIQNQLNFTELRNDIKEFQKKFGELLSETKIDKLVVFIDELDRCSPDTIIETLEAMRLFVFTGNTVFIIGADERHISYSVERKFSEIQGNQINIGKEYLEKLVQYPVRIPKLTPTETQYYIFCLLLEDSSKLNEEKTTVLGKIKELKKNHFLDFKLQKAITFFETENWYGEIKDIYMVSNQLSNVLSNGLNGNPRQCKRFLNSMKMREIMAAANGIQFERKILTKIMLLEYFKPSVFEQVTILANQTSDGKVEHLSKLENEEDCPENALQSMLDDEWGKNWIMLSPQLGNMDIRGYLFFSRDSLRNPIKFSNLGLSKAGKQIYELLNGKGTSVLKEALEMKDTISQYEKMEITNEYFSNNINISGPIDNIKFRSFFEWITGNKDIVDEGARLLSLINSEKIQPAWTPYIADYIKQKENTSSRMIDTISNWRNGNQHFNAAMKINLGEK